MLRPQRMGCWGCSDLKIREHYVVSSQSVRGAVKRFLFPQSTTQGYALHKVEDSAVQLLSFVASASLFVNELSVVLSCSALLTENLHKALDLPACSNSKRSAFNCATIGSCQLAMDSKVDKCRKTMINDDKCSILTGPFVLLALLAPTLPSSGVLMLLLLSVWACWLWSNLSKYQEESHSLCVYGDCMTSLPAIRSCFLPPPQGPKRLRSDMSALETRWMRLYPLKAATCSAENVVFKYRKCMEML